MHGSVCLFSKYLSHLFEGENLNELDISSASSSNNIFSNKKSLSSGWTGTCPVFELFKSIYYDYNTESLVFVSKFSSYHQKTIDEYNTISSSLEKIFTTSNIDAPPSDTKKTLTPIFESEFKDKTNKNLIGGQIYNDFQNQLNPYIQTLENTIEPRIKTLLNSNTLQTEINNAYTNIGNFDVAVSTASNIMNKRILDLKDYFLTLQFLLMFFTWIYFIFFVVIVIIYIIYLCKEYEPLYIVLVILVNILFVLMLIEIFISSYFGQVRLICHEVPRAMNFIFTGTYMVSGNSASYPAQFGRGNAEMTKMFTSCLNGDGYLINLLNINNALSSIGDTKNIVALVYTLLNEIINSSNLALKNYNSIDNSILFKAIVKLELMKDNLYLASEGFGEDEIFKILSNIRTNLDSQNCSMTSEYFVIKSSDCPSGSLILTTSIYYTEGQSHCYVIQNLTSNAYASYSGSDCNNNYINNAITFIKKLDSLLDERLTKLKNFQLHYSSTYKYLLDEIYSTSYYLNNTFSLVNNYLNSVTNISNCLSVRYDLIDFCDFIGDTTEYDARIVVIFTSFLGVFGFVMLYSFLVVLNGFRQSEKDYYYDYDDDYGHNYGKNKKVKNINIKVNKLNRKDISYEDDEEDDDNDNYKNTNKNKRGKTPQKNTQKVEMSYMAKNNEDSDSS